MLNILQIFKRFDLLFSSEDIFHCTESTHSTGYTSIPRISFFSLTRYLPVCKKRHQRNFKSVANKNKRKEEVYISVIKKREGASQYDK